LAIQPCHVSGGSELTSIDSRPNSKTAITAWLNNRRQNFAHSMANTDGETTTAKQHVTYTKQYNTYSHSSTAPRPPTPSARHLDDRANAADTSSKGSLYSFSHHPTSGRSNGYGLILGPARSRKTNGCRSTLCQETRREDDRQTYWET